MRIVLRSCVGLLAACLLSTSAMANDMTYQTSAATDDGLPVFYPELKQQLTYPDSWLSGNFKDFAAWQIQSRQTLRAMLLTPDSHRAFAPATVDSEDHGAKFDIGKGKMIKPWGNAEKLASAQAWADKFFTGRFVGDELAKRGYVVLAVDAIGWGDRGPLKYEQQQVLASNFFNLGRSLAGEMAYEDVRATDFLASLKQVDAKRIGVVGFSMGAYRAWQLASLSDKVAVTAAVSWIGTYEGLMTPGNNVLRVQSSFYMLHPGLPAHFDFLDVASVAAPNPMLFFNGGKDKLFPESAVQGAYDKMHRVWQSQKADNKLETKIWPELGHVFYQEQQVEVFAWLDRWLMPKS